MRDHLLANKIDVCSFFPPTKLVFSCISAYSRHQANLKEKPATTVRDVEKDKKELLREEIISLVKRELKLKDTCTSFESKFVKLVSDAEKSPSEMQTLIIEANNLKRRQNELNEELKELQHEIEEKRRKLK